MTRRECMLAALRRKPVDRVPFATYNLHPYEGGSHRDDPSYRDLLALVEAQAGMYCKRFVPGVLPSASDPAAANRSVRVEQVGTNTVTTTILHTPRGNLQSVGIKPPDQPGYVVEHFLRTDEDIACYLSLPWQPAEYDTTALRAFLAQLGDRGVATVGYGDPMHAAASLFDFEDFCVRYATQPESIQRMIDHFHERIAEDTRRKAAACHGLDVIFLCGGPELATPPLMPPRAFAELVVPSHTKLIEIIHAAGHLAMMHCHGRVRDVLDGMLATGVDAIEPVEPPPQGDIALADLMARADGRLSFFGHIQDQELHTVPAGTMTRHVEEIAQAVDGRTGYIMGPTCTPFQHPATPTYLHNYTEWIEAAARVFGA